MHAQDPAGGPVCDSMAQTRPQWWVWWLKKWVSGTTCRVPEHASLVVDGGNRASKG